MQPDSNNKLLFWSSILLLLSVLFEAFVEAGFF